MLYQTTEQHEELRARIRAFAEEEVKPVAFMYDVSKTHVSYLISDAFKYSNIALLSVTYNLKVFPPMQAFVEDMAALNLQKRVVAVVENGTWAPQAGTLIGEQLDKMKEMTVLNEQPTILSSVNDGTCGEICGVADSIIESMA